MCSYTECKNVVVYIYDGAIILIHTHNSFVGSGYYICLQPFCLFQSISFGLVTTVKCSVCTFKLKTIPDAVTEEFTCTFSAVQKPRTYELMFDVVLQVWPLFKYLSLSGSCKTFEFISVVEIICTYAHFLMLIGIHEITRTRA